MSHSPFCVVGNISIDDLVFADGATDWRVPGGNAVYAALGLALWVERPAIIAPCGPDYPIDRLLDRIDLTHCRRLERTLRNWGLYEEDGTRSFVFRSQTRNWNDFSPTLEDVTGDWRYAHIGALPWDLQQAVARKLKQQGAELVSLDLDDRWLEAGRDEALRTLLSSLDLFLPSRQDVRALFPREEPLGALRRLRDLAPELPVIAIKCGPDGVILHQAGATDYLRIPTIAREVIDATGAGDAFCGGMLAGFAATGDALAAALQGSVSASFALSAVGPDGLIAAQTDEALRRLDLLRGRVTRAAF